MQAPFFYRMACSCLTVVQDESPQIGDTTVEGKNLGIRWDFHDSMNSPIRHMAANEVEKVLLACQGLTRGLLSELGR